MALGAGRPSLREAERFWSKVTVVDDATSCWLWQAYISTNGYGEFRREFDGERYPLVKAHRWAYEYVIGPVPDGLDLDHLCRTRACVRPDHLEPVSRSENLRRGDMARTAPRSEAWKASRRATWARLKAGGSDG